EAAALEQRAEARRKHLARDERDGRDDGATPAAPEGRAELVLEAPHQTDAVLGDRETLVGVRGRRLPAGEEVDLVGEKDEAAPQLGLETLLPAADGVHEPARLVGPEAAERGEALAVAREPDGHDGGRRHR